MFVAWIGGLSLRHVDFFGPTDELVVGCGVELSGCSVSGSVGAGGEGWLFFWSVPTGSMVT